jgi:hypothetical protein
MTLTFVSALIAATSSMLFAHLIVVRLERRGAVAACSFGMKGRMIAGFGQVQILDTFQTAGFCAFKHHPEKFVGVG